MTQLIITDLLNLLQQINDADYTKRIERLNQSTIGQHVRHSIEMYQLVVHHCAEQTIDYSSRKRDLVLETSSSYAIECLYKIQKQIIQEDKILYVKNNHDEIAVLSSYNREIMYCNEHLIHHMALIKVALQETEQYNIANTFGIAPSTIQYRQQCAQ